MEVVKRVYGWICKAEEAIANVSMVAAVVIVFVSALFRSVGYPLGWGIDMATFLFAWATFLSADIAMRADRHVRVEVLVRLLPRRAQYYIELVNYAIILVFLACLVWYGVSMSTFTRFRTFQGIPGFSYMWATLSVPAGSLLLFVTTLLKAWDFVKRNRRPAYPSDVRGDVKA